MASSYDSYVPLQNIYNQSNRSIQILVGRCDKKAASKDSDVPYYKSSIVTVFPGQTLKIEPDRIDQYQLQNYQNTLPIQQNASYSIGIVPSTSPPPYDFNSTCYLECLNHDNLPSYNEPRSMFGWVKPAIFPSGRQGLFGYGPVLDDSINGSSVMIYNEQGKRESGFFGSSYFTPQKNNILLADRWNFVGMSWSGSILTVYINDTSKSVMIDSLDTPDEVFKVGLPAGGNMNDLFIGNIKSISVWGICHSSSFVSSLRKLGPVTYDQVTRDLLNQSIMSIEPTMIFGDYIFGSVQGPVDTDLSIYDLRSYWNLDTFDSINYDSVSDNSLTKITV